MRIRRNIRNLSAEDKARFVAALIKLKKDGKFDKYVHWHHEAMMKPTSLPGEPVDAMGYRNAAHRGPVFFPWHREFLKRLEMELGDIEKDIGIPYWDWTQDAGLPDGATSPIWADDFMGGNGVGKERIVETGPFAYKNGNWPLVQAHGSRPELQRDFRKWALEGLPNKDDVKVAMSESIYDIFPWNANPFTLGFRNKCEGWVSPEADQNFGKPGRQLHNRVHRWVGGTMLQMVSPNDPIFFLHHSFCDKLWAIWQKQMIGMGATKEDTYAPHVGGPLGHNIDDQMEPWDSKTTPKSVLDHQALGYAYDDEALSTTHELLNKQILIKQHF